MSSGLENKIQKYISHRPYLKKILTNIGWLGLDRLFQVFISFVVVVWMIRYLGPEQFGILSYAWAFTAIFGSFSSFGLYNILVRDLVKFPEKKSVLIGTALAIVLSTGFIGTICSIIVAYLISSDNPLVLLIILISVLQLLFYPFTLFSAWFDSRVNSKYVVFSRNLMLITASIAKVLLIVLGKGIIYFAIVSLFETILFAFWLIYFYSSKSGGLFDLKFDLNLAKDFVKESFPITLSLIATAIYLRVDQILIEQMLSLREVGVYAVAVKVVEFGGFIPGIVITSVTPATIVSQRDKRLYLRRFSHLNEFLSLLSIGIAIFLTIFSTPIISILYGENYSAAIGVLAIYSWSLVPWFFTIALAQYFVIEKKTPYAFYTALIGAVSNITLNLALIPLLGIYGAAIATVASYSTVVLGLLLFKQTREYFFIILKSLNIIKTLKNLISRIRN